MKSPSFLFLPLSPSCLPLPGSHAHTGAPQSYLGTAATLLLLSLTLPCSSQCLWSAGVGRHGSLDPLPNSSLDPPPRQQPGPPPPWLSRRPSGRGSDRHFLGCRVAWALWLSLQCQLVQDRCSRRAEWCVSSEHLVCPELCSRPLRHVEHDKGEDLAQVYPVAPDWTLCVTPAAASPACHTLPRPVSAQSPCRCLSMQPSTLAEAPPQRAQPRAPGKVWRAAQHPCAGRSGLCPVSRDGLCAAGEAKGLGPGRSGREPT